MTPTPQLTKEQAEKLRGEFDDFFNKHKDTHKVFKDLKTKKPKKVSQKRPASGKYPYTPGNSHDRRIIKRKINADKN